MRAIAYVSLQLKDGGWIIWGKRTGEPWQIIPEDATPGARNIEERLGAVLKNTLSSDVDGAKVLVTMSTEPGQGN